MLRGAAAAATLSFWNARSKVFHKHSRRDSHCITGLLPSVCSEIRPLAPLQFIKVDIEWRRISFPVFNYIFELKLNSSTQWDKHRKSERYFVSIHINSAERRKILPRLR